MSEDGLEKIEMDIQNRQSQNTQSQNKQIQDKQGSFEI